MSGARQGGAPFASPFGSIDAPDAVSRFLWSIGKRAEADFYLALFQAEEKERFAAIAVDGPVITHALDALVVDLRFLAAFGLTPVVVLGLLDATNAARDAAALAQALTRSSVRCRVFDAEAPLVHEARSAARAGEIPIIPLDVRKPDAQRLDALHGLIVRISTRKLIFLQRRGGIAIDGKGVGIVELNSGLDTLLASPDVSRKQRTILTSIAYVLDHIAHPCTFTLTSPLDLLRELFTTAGAGTLVRRAARIESHADYRAIDTQRLKAMLESAFNKPLTPGFLDRPVSRVYLEAEYRGAAMVIETELGAYMSKFAVGRQAQGEGIGRDVWAALVADYTTVFWRSRESNPVNVWYTKQCDGMARSGAWQVFWRRMPVERIPQAIAFALEQPKDFPRS
jgi:hypothetical protein